MSVTTSATVRPGCGSVVVMRAPKRVRGQNGIAAPKSGAAILRS